MKKILIFIFLFICITSFAIKREIKDFDTGKNIEIDKLSKIEEIPEIDTISYEITLHFDTGTYTISNSFKYEKKEEKTSIDTYTFTMADIQDISGWSRDDIVLTNETMIADTLSVPIIKAKEIRFDGVTLDKAILILLLMMGTLGTISFFINIINEL